LQSTCYASALSLGFSAATPHSAAEEPAKIDVIEREIYAGISHVLLFSATGGTVRLSDRHSSTYKLQLGSLVLEFSFEIFAITAPKYGFKCTLAATSVANGCSE
jgi:hypothetical protein